MSAAGLRAIAGRILQQFRHDRRTLVLLFVAPLVILGLFDLLLRGSSNIPTVDVVNLDRGPLGAAVAQNLERSSAVHAGPASLDSATQALADASIAAYVLLPENFSARAFTSREVVPEVRLEGSQPSYSQPVLLAVDQAVAAAAQRLLSAAGVDPPTVTVRAGYLHGGPELDALDSFAAGVVGLVVFFLVFVITIIAFLRERSQGTLERLMASPLRRGDLVVGYMLGFGAIAVVQAVEVLAFTLYVLHVHNEGNVGAVLLLTLLMTLVAVNLGIFLSTFARTEFQAVQFIPLIIVPQVLLCGIIFPVSAEPTWLQAISNVLPLTYGVSGLRDVMLSGAALSSTAVLLCIGVLAAYVVVLVVAAAATLRRQIA